MHGSFRRRAAGSVKQGSKRRTKHWLEVLEERLVMSAPAAPSDLTASALSSSQIRVTWRDNSADETGFVVQRAPVGGAFAAVATVGANATSFSDGGLTGGARYSYRIAALNGSGASTYSYPVIANALATFQTNAHPEPQRIGNYRWGLPGDRVDVVSGAQNNVFYQGQSINFELRWNGGHARTYEVRNYWGEMVDSGACPPPGTLLNVRVSQPGWYKVTVFGGQTTAEYGDVKGGTTFAVFRNDPNFPQMPAATNPMQRSSQIARGVTAMGPERLNAWDVTQPDKMIAELAPEVALAKQYYLGYDPVRPRDLTMAFTNGTRNLADPSQDAMYLDGVRKIVQRFHNDVKYYECRNEPHDYESAEQMVEEMRQLYNVVKSVDPTCKVIGPSIVNLSQGYSLAFLDRFFAAGGGQYIDGLSFHVYNAIVGDPETARFNFSNLQAVLTKYGKQNIEKWQTEQGWFSAEFGVAQPRVQGRWTLMQMMLQDQFGIPKEHNNIWYDQSGFWDVPAFWMASEDGSMMPAPVVMRVFSEEVFGTRFAKAYDFGPTGKDLYVGNLYTGPSGKSVAAFMSSGSTTGKVTLKVTGGSGQLKVTDAMGVSKMLAVVNGQVDLDVGETTVYVDMAPGQTIDVVPQDMGSNLAMLPGTTFQTSGNGQHPLGGGWLNSISKVANGKLDTWNTDPWADGDLWYDNTPAGQQVWFQVNLPSEQTVSHVNIFSGVPNSIRGSMLDYELQYDRNGVWTTIEHVQEDPKTVGTYFPWTHSTVDSFYSQRSVFQHDFDPVKTSKLRLLVHEVTYGGEPTLTAVQAGGQPGLHVLNLREIQVYGDGTAPASPNKAVTVALDDTTSGNWKGKYGSQGYVIVGDAVQLPAGVSVKATNPALFAWANPSSQARALQKATSATDRIAGCWYEGQFTIDVNITDGKEHKVSLYMLDYDNLWVSRSQKIQVIDADSGAIYDSYTATSFGNGRYVSWDVRGHVLIKILNVGPSNAVVSGVFIDPGTGKTGADPGANNRAPVAVAGTDLAGPAGASFGFDGSGSSDPDGNPLTYAWDFGDGTTGSGARASHAFGRPGLYTVMLNVSDGSLTSQSILKVNVSDVAPTVALSGASEAFEGAAYTLTIGALTNPANHVVAQYIVRWGDGTSDTYTTAGAKTHVFADGPLAANVTVDLVDDAGARFAAAGSLAVAVRNVNPTVSVTSAVGSSAVVSSPLRYVAVAGDAGSADVVAGLTYVWSVTRDGAAFALPAGVRTDLSTFEFVPTVAGTYVVTARATDKDGGAGQGGATVTVTVTPGTPSPNTAGFVAEDAATSGNWKGVYGADGYSIVGDATALPAYATKSSSGDLSWTWDAGPADPRALQRAGSGRVAATLYGNSFTIDLNLSGGSRRVAAYFVDYDGASRVQQIEVLDGDTGAVLDSRSISGFVGGKYLVWNLAGHVKIRVTRLAGVNAVMEGLFFDGNGGGGGGPVDTTPPAVTSRTPAQGATNVAADANVAATFGEDVQASTVAFTLKDAAGNAVAASAVYDAASRTVTLDPNAALLPSATYTAYLSGAKDAAGNAMAAVNWSFTTAAAPSSGTSVGFVREDATTRGNWKGAYGADGYNVIGDARAYRPYATVTASGNTAYTWANSDWTLGGLQKASMTAGDRVAACWYSGTSFTIDIDLTDGLSHRLALYFLDWDTQNRKQTVTVSDATTGAVLDTRSMTDFAQGKYLVYDLKGHVRITVANAGGMNAVMSGIFFG